MYRNITMGISLLFFGSIFYAYAEQASAKGNDGVAGNGMQQACEISGGSFIGSENGNWACCWDDWGCYGCVDGKCKIKCNTARCKKANGMTKLRDGEHPVTGSAVKGLVQPGERAPVAP